MAKSVIAFSKGSLRIINFLNLYKIVFQILFTQPLTPNLDDKVLFFENQILICRLVHVVSFAHRPHFQENQKSELLKF